MGAVGGVVAVVFGIGWTYLAYSITEGAPHGVRVVFPLFGVLFIVVGIVNVIYNVVNAGSKNRLSQLDVVTDDEEPDPISRLVQGPQSRSAAVESTVDERLKKLGELRTRGTISEVEYAEQRRRILSDI